MKTRIHRHVLFAFLCLCAQLLHAQRTLEYKVGKETRPNRIRCVGAELDAHFHANHVPRSEGSKVEDWANVIVPRIKDMQVQSLRVMVLPQWYEPRNDNDDPAVADNGGFCFDAPQMQSLYPILDLAQEMGIPVTIVPWGATPESFMSSRKGWIVLPENHEEYAENISALLCHLIKDRKYNCIDEVTPGNEPDGWGMPSSEYVSLCKTLHARLEKDRLLKHVRLNLVDNTDRGGSFDYLEECVSGLKGIADVVNSHTYIFGYDTPSEKIMQWDEQNCRIAARAGLRHCVGEFGSNQTMGASRQKDIDQYRRGVLMVRTAISLLAAGAYNISYWQLFDQYYSRHDNYAQMQQLGMWKSVKADYATEAYHSGISCDYEARPQFYAYSLLTRFVRPGARVYSMTADGDMGLTNALCVRNRDKSWVYVVANQENTDLCVTLRNERHPLRGHYEQYVYQEGLLPNDGSQLKPLNGVREAAGSLSVDIPANTVMLFRFRR